jgi:hypothetical protein
MATGRTHYIKREGDSKGCVMGAVVPYERFRTGLTYHDVYMMLWDRQRKGRHIVLGKWMEIKREMYAEYLRRLDEMQASNDNATGGDAGQGETT